MPDTLGEVHALTSEETKAIRKMSAIQFNNGDLLDMRESEKIQREMFA